MTPLALVLLTIPLAADAHEQSNPLYRELRQTGVTLNDKVRSPLPAPTLADGLDAKAQKKVIDAVAGADYDPQELLRKSATAPFRFQVRDLEPPDSHSRAFAIDVWFIAHGDLPTITQKEFLEKLLESGNKEHKVQVLTEAELAQRKLAAKADGKYEERFTHAVFVLLNDVQLGATSHTVLTQTDESLLFASRLDPRFTKDAEFPNQWRSLKKDEEGKTVLGPPHPYAGSGSYLKITRLKREVSGRDDALFVEGHLVFVEPREWFASTNRLRSKLPTLIQDQVRSFRRELEKRSPRR
jgi:hypothetical protein